MLLHTQMRGMGCAIGARSEKPIIEVDVQVVDLHYPHQVHRIATAGEPAIGFIDVIANCLWCMRCPHR